MSAKNLDTRSRILGFGRGGDWNRRLRNAGDTPRVFHLYAGPICGAISMKPQLILRAAFFTLLFPGVVTIYLPFSLLGDSISQLSSDLTLMRIVIAVVGVISAGILLHCIWAFAFYGKGTLAPIDPPTSFVVQGFYKYCRNPMYIAVILVLLCETLFFQSLALFRYTFVAMVAFYLFVRLYEEPHLRNQFGEQYRDYWQKVPRWGIAHRPYIKDNGAA
jgi:protein-S-isoprenylcysteine O-methyltransferase Ste14